VHDEVHGDVHLAEDDAHGFDQEWHVRRDQPHDVIGRVADLRPADRQVAIGGERDAASKYLAPTVLTGVKPDAAVMDDEIFGPILPVLTYEHLDEAIAFVNDRPKPLALYVFGSKATSIDRVVERTSAGGVTINHTLLHVSVHDLPFGGVGASGMGSYHGEAGFAVFSHAKPILQRNTKLDSSVAYPPYTAFKQRVLRRIL